MLRVSRTVSNILAIVGGLSLSVGAEAQTPFCGTVSTPEACATLACSDATLPCLATAMRFDPVTGAFAYDCTCATSTACHLVSTAAGADCTGACASGVACALVEFDENNDGIHDGLRCQCAPPTLEGVCCLDISDGPIAFETCTVSLPDACHLGGGVFHGVNADCTQTQACCMVAAGASYCAELNPHCCIASGGEPMGPSSTCADPTGVSNCPQVCGGFAGTPCDAGQFCRLNPGECCCDFQGICLPIPVGCPEYFQPVCGCDGVTYDNECFAAEASVSVDHDGPCERPCGPNHPPCDANQFCKYPMGSCGSATAGGMCTAIPTGCPDVWDPVCGCDGMTYGNECEADAAGVSILHHGACANLCVPTADRSACEPAPCSVIPEVSCTPTTLHLDVATGAITVVECQCWDMNVCHVEFGNATPHPVGHCPTGLACEVIGIDLDGDGQDDTFTAACAPTGACCSDLGGSPLPVPVCRETTERQCHGTGFFEGVGTTCPGTAQACCLPYGSDYCVEIGPHCCRGFGGVPQGPGTTCVDVTGQGGCPQMCGGIAGIPCGAGEFCEYPPGTCHIADRSGYCHLIPPACPPVWIPVCGCDGLTYGNECEAQAAGMSIDHPGECNIGACCLNDPTGVALCVMETEESCLAAGGTHMGVGTQCPPNPAALCHPPTGACCLPIGLCVELPLHECRAKDGRYEGDGTLCPPNYLCPAPVGACCVHDPATASSCIEVNEPECSNQGGTYQGDGTTCPADPTVPCDVPCDVACPSGQRCFAGCGTLVGGANCLLFEADSGGRFLIDNSGGFTAGDRVFVKGCLQPDCLTPCATGNGCLYVNTITACETTPYGLNPGSTYQFGCFPPCMCPISAEFPVRGGFDLNHVGSDMWFEHYSVTNIHWRVLSTSPAVPPDLIITGSGRYRIGGDFALMHQMQLDLRVGDGPVQHFDSGPVLGGAAFPRIRITVSENNMVCFDTVIVIDASPLGACCLADSTGNVHCVLGTERNCSAQSGTFLGEGTTCPADPTLPCEPPTGACCLNNAAGVVHCFVGTREECVLEGGAYQGHGTTCPTDPNVPCGEPCPMACPPGEPCFTGCGELVQGAPCVMFLADSGELFELDNLGGFTVGDRVYVAGCVAPVCLDTCMHGNGCVHNNLIAPCPRLCGGITGIPCDDPAEFCKFPPGLCDAADIMGVCTPIPMGCPDVWAPVCGCDGVIYGNECEADAVGIQIDYPGACRCEPSPDGLSCSGSCMSVIPEISCVATTAHRDPLTNTYRISACECIDWMACQIVLEPSGPTAQGVCPSNAPDCQLHGTDTNGDGVDDILRAVCEQPCGGIAGLPCDDGEFCLFPPGTCDVADRMGVCRDLPDPNNVGCTTEWEPVCGCDGVTYGNICEMMAAGQSMDHPGECEEPCCDPATAPPCIEGPHCCADGTWVCGDGGGGTTCTAPGVVCPTVCGGIAGIPCDDPGTFCKFPPGTCNGADMQGVCTPVPGGGCPEIYDPVCGCDGVTYVNECEADAARVSIDHPGPCVGGDCAATRVLVQPQPAYCPGVPKRVHIALTPPAGTMVLALEDAPPAGWVVVDISHNGTFDAVNGKVKWGPFFPPFPHQVGYAVIPSNDAVGPHCFSGAVSVDGINQAICGDECIDLFCRPLIPADEPQPACPTCPVGDCDACPHGVCRDGQVSLCEGIGYACAWKVGCNDDLAGMARAAYIWKNGECYCWDESGQNWQPHACPAPASGYCSATSASSPAGAAVSSDGGGAITVKAQVTSARLRRFGAGEQVKASIPIEPPKGTSVVALELQIPKGWEVTYMSDGGTWDAGYRKIKWGPFFEDPAAYVVFKANRTTEKSVRQSPRNAPATIIDGFIGTVSYDGVNHPITIK